MKELFKNKNFSLLFMGNLVSEMGNVIFGFVAGLYVQDLAEQSGGSLLGIKSGIILALFIGCLAFHFWAVGIGWGHKSLFCITQK